MLDSVASLEFLNNLANDPLGSLRHIVDSEKAEGSVGS